MTLAWLTFYGSNTYRTFRTQALNFGSTHTVGSTGLRDVKASRTDNVESRKGGDEVTGRPVDF